MRTITLALTSQGNETSLSEVAALGAALTAASAELRGMPLETVDADKLAASVSVTVGPFRFTLRAEEQRETEISKIMRARAAEHNP